MSEKNRITTKEKEQIKQAVREAEKRTSGEIVPYFVDRSDDYDESLWKGAFMSGIIALAVLYLLQYTAMVPGITVSIIAVSVPGAALLGFLGALLIPFLRKLFAGGEILNRRVHQRALEAFIEEEVFTTRDRTGILIFISHFEHMVIVLGDTGINELVSRDEWQEVVSLIVDGIKRGKEAEGIIQAIQKCGALLERAGLNIKEDDTNELSNELRTDGELR